MSLTVHVIEASASPPGTDCVAQAALKQPPSTIGNLLPLPVETRRHCCLCGLLLFHFDVTGVFVELEPFWLLEQKNVSGRVQERAHLRGRGSGRGLRGLLGVAGGSRRLLRDWLLCTCLSTLLFRSSKVVMAAHCRRSNKISPVGGLLPEIRFL